jgi:hypothetical protein
MLKKTFCLLLSFLSLSACKSSKEALLAFGNGGGFTGASQMYTLSSKGMLSQYNSLSNDSTKLGEIPAKQVKFFFEEARKLKLDTLKFNEPGNMYRFIEFAENGKTNRVTWGKAGQTPPTGCEALYDSLHSIIPKKP